MKSPSGHGSRLLPHGLLMLALALIFWMLWVGRKPIDTGVWELGSRSLGIAVPLSEFASGVFGAASTALALACVVWAFLAAWRTFFVPCPGVLHLQQKSQVRNEKSEESYAEGAETAEKGVWRVEIQGPKSETRDRKPETRCPRLGFALAAALFILCAVPIHMAIGWADGHLVRLAHYDADWYRRALLRELIFAVPPQLFCLAAVLMLGTWLVAHPCGRWCERLSRALEAMARAPRKPVVAAGCAAFLAVSAAYVLGITRGEPLYPDAYGYRFQARMFASGRLWSTVAADPAFFSPALCPHSIVAGFVFMGGRMFFCALPFGPLLYAMGELAGCAWVVPMLLGGAVVALTYVIASDAFGPTAGLVALGLAAVCPWLVIESGDYMLHLPCLVPMLVFVLATRRVFRGGSWLWAVGAGLALGLGFAARPVTAAGLCVPFAVAWLVWLVRSPRRAWVPTLAFAAGLALPVAGLLVYNARTTGDVLTLGYQVAFRDYERMWPSAGWRWRPIVSVANMFLFMYFIGPSAYHWPIPFAGVVLAAAVLLRLWRGSARDSWPLLLGLAALCLAAAYSIADVDPLILTYPEGPRYVFEALPFLIVLAAGSLVALQRRLSSAGVSPARSSAVLAVLVAAFVACGTFHTAVFELAKFERFLSNKELTRAVALHARKPAIVFLVVPPSRRATCQFAADITGNDPSMAGPVVYARDLGPRNRELAAALPGRHLYRWDPASRSLVPLGDPAEAPQGPP